MKKYLLLPALVLIALAAFAWITPSTSALSPRPPAQTLQSADDVLADAVANVGSLDIVFGEVDR